MNVANFEYFLRNVKDCESQSATTKKGDSKKYCNYYRFSTKMDDDAPRQKRESPRMLIITIVFEEFGWYRRCARDGGVSHFEYGRDYSKILRPQR